MPANQSLNQAQSRTLETPVRTISVATGSVVVTPPEGFGDAFTLKAGQAYTFTGKPVAGLTIFSPNAARFHLTYGDDAPSTEANRNRTGARPARKAAKKKPAKRAATKPAAKKASKKPAKRARKTTSKKRG